MTRPARAIINLAALRHNLDQVRQHAPDSKVIAVIKANGYGHGILRAAEGLKEADAFAVACIEEAKQLRDAGYQHRILLLEGVFQKQELASVIELTLEMVVHNSEQISWLEQADLESPITVWLKIDSGMHRLGVSPEDFSESWSRLQSCVNVNDEIIVMTHMACADDRSSESNLKQLALFKQATNSVQSPKSISNSAALMSIKEAHVDWVRPGIMLYGSSPFIGSIANDENLQSVMTLRSELIAVHDFKRGDKVGYGEHWVCPENMRVGVVAIGYGDGYPRHATNDTPVLVKGIKTNLAGRVSMDMITVDLRSIPDAVIGDEVVLWGEGLPIEQVADSVGTISYELMCHITPRVHIEVIN